MQKLNSNYLYEVLRKHIGHHIEIVVYGDNQNMSVECEDCGCVLFDTDCYDLTGIC